MTQEEVELVWMCGYSGHDDTSRVDATADETKATCNSGHVTDQKNLDRALTIVKAAGYRVSKPKTPKRKNCIGPTFVAEFADGAITRMSTFTSLENLDWGRGERLSQAAYQSRWRTRERVHRRGTIALFAPAPPPIIAAHFERDAEVLESYGREQLDALSKGGAP